MLRAIRDIPKWKACLLVGAYLACVLVSVLHPSFAGTFSWWDVWWHGLRGGGRGGEDDAASADCTRMVIMSHRAAMPPSLGDMSSQPPGSTEAVVSIMQRGVCAFDADCFSTVDDVLVVGHPVEVQKRLSLGTPPTDLTLEQLHMLDRGKIITVFEFLRAVVELAPESGPCRRHHRRGGSGGEGAWDDGASDEVRKNGDDRGGGGGGDGDGEEREGGDARAAGLKEHGKKPHRRKHKKSTPLRLLLEPKGESATKESVATIATAAKAAGLAPDEVGVWVQTPELADAARATAVLTPLFAVKTKPPQGWGLGALLQGFSQDTDWASYPETWKGVGPPIDYPDLPAFAARARDQGQILLSWVVDSKEDLIAALRASAEVVISNEPFEIAKELASMCPGWRP